MKDSFYGVHWMLATPFDELLRLIEPLKPLGRS